MSQNQHHTLTLLFLNGTPTAFQFIQDNISIGILFTIGNAKNGGDY
jgi:hypothetical protein